MPKVQFFIFIFDFLTCGEISPFFNKEIGNLKKKILGVISIHFAKFWG